MNVLILLRCFIHFQYSDFLSTISKIFTEITLCIINNYPKLFSHFRNHQHWLNIVQPILFALSLTLILQFLRLARGIGFFFPLACQKSLLIRQSLKILSQFFFYSYYYYLFKELTLSCFLYFRVNRIFKKMSNNNIFFSS